MRKSLRKLLDVAVGLVLAVGIFLLSGILSGTIRESALLEQSRVFGSLMKEDSVDIVSIVSETYKRQALGKFLPALTNAYVDFELIPYNEGKTLMAVINSLNSGIEIIEFAYSGKDLIITGKGSPEDFQLFLEKLEATQRFDQIEQWAVSPVFDEEGRIDFVVRCYGHTSDPYPEIFGLPVGNGK